MACEVCYGSMGAAYHGVVWCSGCYERKIDLCGACYQSSPDGQQLCIHCFVWRQIQDHPKLSEVQTRLRYMEKLEIDEDERLNARIRELEQMNKSSLGQTVVSLDEHSGSLIAPQTAFADFRALVFDDKYKTKSPFEAVTALAIEVRPGEPTGIKVFLNRGHPKYEETYAFVTKHYPATEFPYVRIGEGRLNILATSP